MIKTAATLSALFVTALGLTGCSGPHPFVRDGDAKSVDITYSGDPATAFSLAQKHCGQYERVPRLTYRTTDEAQYDCVSPQRGP